jgi:hypothetical protein
MGIAFQARQAQAADATVTLPADLADLRKRLHKPRPV